MPLKFTTRNLGFQNIVGLTTATKLTVPAQEASYAIIQAELGSVRWRDDGVAPTPLLGMLLKAGAQIFYDGDLRAIQFIKTSASANLNVSYYV